MQKPHNLRRVADNVPWRLWIVACIGFFERAAFWGLTAPWQNYMQNPRSPTKEHAPGALGLGQALATRIYCCFYIFYYVAPLAVAYIADRRLGQFTSLIISVVLYCSGILVLTISSTTACLDRGWGVPGLVISMFLIGLGGGGVKAILPPFLADQYDKEEPQLKTLKTGETVVTDYELTLQYIYNLYFWVGNIGSLSWFGTVFVEKRYGFAEAYGLCLGLLTISLVMLIMGKRWFMQVSHKDNLIVPQAAKIVACAVKNGFKMSRAYHEYQFENCNKLVSWTDSMVDELTRGLRGCRVLLTFVTFYVCFDQMQNNLISQAGQMKTGGTPNDLLPALNQVGCIVMGPLIQMGLYPFLHRRRIYIGPIMRITIGFGFIALAMLYATVVQHVIYKSTPCYDKLEKCAASDSKPSQPNVWMQAPVYILISTGEIFSFVTGLEYAYDHSPKDMKVIVQAISMVVGGIGSAIALALSVIAHDPNLVIFYASLTIAMAVTTFVFYIVFRNYDRTGADVADEEQLGRQATAAEKGSVLDKDDKQPSSTQTAYDERLMSREDIVAKEVQIEVEACKDSEEISIPNALHQNPSRTE
ncbi:POT family-domain-containing protein [Phaeosphaeria sp. MPI-PUGE-AT-0046c]|nr:POT family-domain-containing protein [Phaeosphaeria sp. MPI-PUGE-AT-0046c]